MEKFYKRFTCKKWRKFFIGDFHVKLKVSFEFFTRDFPGKKIEWKKFWKGFLWNIEAGFTPALVLHVLYFPLKLSLIVSEEAISSRRRPPPPETKSERSECLWKKWSEKVKWSESESIFGPLNFFIFRYVEGGVLGNNYISIKKCTTTFLWVLNFGQVGEIFKNFQNQTTTVTFFKNGVQLVNFAAEIWENFGDDFFLKKNFKGFPL